MFNILNKKLGQAGSLSGAEQLRWTKDAIRDLGRAERWSSSSFYFSSEADCAVSYFSSFHFSNFHPLVFTGKEVGSFFNLRHFYPRFFDLHISTLTHWVSLIYKKLMFASSKYCNAKCFRCHIVQPAREARGPEGSVRWERLGCYWQTVRCPHSGVGEDFLGHRRNSGTKSRRLDPLVSKFA